MTIADLLEVAARGPPGRRRTRPSGRRGGRSRPPRSRRGRSPARSCAARTAPNAGLGVGVLRGRDVEAGRAAVVGDERGDRLGDVGSGSSPDRPDRDEDVVASARRRPPRAPPGRLEPARMWPRSRPRAASPRSSRPGSAGTSVASGRAPRTRSPARRGRDERSRAAPIVAFCSSRSRPSRRRREGGGARGPPGRRPPSSSR